MNSDFTTIKTLLLRAKNPDDHQAWEDFQKFYSTYIYMVLTKFLYDKEDLEDLKQDILVKLWQNLKNYNFEKSKFRTWLSTVIRNTVLNYYRKKANESRTLIPFAEDVLLNNSESKLEDFIISEWCAPHG